MCSKSYAVDSQRSVHATSIQPGLYQQGRRKPLVPLLLLGDPGPLAELKCPRSIHYLPLPPAATKTRLRDTKCSPGHTIKQPLDLKAETGNLPGSGKVLPSLSPSYEVKCLHRSHQIILPHLVSQQSTHTGTRCRHLTIKQWDSEFDLVMTYTYTSIYPYIAGLNKKKKNFTMCRSAPRVD